MTASIIFHINVLLEVPINWNFTRATPKMPMVNNLLLSVAVFQNGH
jgi:hypothetical protein